MSNSFWHTRTFIIYKFLFIFFNLFANLPLQSQPSLPGDIVFVGFNADGTDGFAFLTLVDIPINTTIYFTDEEWDGSPLSSGSFTDSEGFISWLNDECLIRSGTIIIIDDASTQPTANFGVAVEENDGFNLSGANEVLYAFIGSAYSAPTSFLSAIANDDFTSGTIANTGLIIDDTAIELDNIGGAADYDVAVYRGSTNCNGTLYNCRLMIANITVNPGNWITDNGSNDQSQDGQLAEFPTANGGGTGLVGDFSGTIFPLANCMLNGLSSWDTSICAHNPVFLEDLLSGSFMGSLQYGTTFGHYPDTITTAVTPDQTTTYFIRDSIAGACCADTTMLTVVVDPMPSILGLSDTICQGEIVYLENLVIGTPLGDIRYGIVPGNYQDTITTPVYPDADILFWIRDSVTSTGCTDTAVVNIKVNHDVYTSETYNGCSGDGYSITVQGVTYNESAPSGTEIFSGLAANGCDSIVFINLAFQDNPTGLFSYSGCMGDGFQIEINGNIYNENNHSGTEILSGGASNGCDSIVDVNLAFHELPFSGPPVLISFCFGDSTSTEIIPIGGIPPASGETFSIIWDFEGEMLNAFSHNPHVYGSPVRIGEQLSNISFPSGNNSTDALSANNWNNEPGDYFEFCVQGLSSDIQITGFNFTDDASGTGPDSYALYSSYDQFTAPLAIGNTHDPFNAVPDSIYDFSFFAMATDSICFQLHASGSSSNSGTWRIDNVNITGHQLLNSSNSVFYNFYSTEDGHLIPGARDVVSYDPLVTEPGTHNYWFSATDGMCFGDTVMASIIINDNPHIKGGMATICAGQTILLENYISGIPLGDVAYGVEFGMYPDTITSGVTPVSDVTYIVRDSIRSTGCADTAVVIINVVPSPEIHGSNDTICSGTSVSLEELINGNPSGILNYGPSFGDYPDTITSLVTPLSDRVYYIRDSIPETGCTDTAIIRIRVEPVPVINGTNVTICRGDTVFLEDYVIGNPLGGLYYGSDPGIYHDTISIGVAPGVDMTYYVIDSAANTGCTDTAVVKIQVTGPSLAPVQPYTNVCPEKYVDLSAILLTDEHEIPGPTIVSYYADSIDALLQIHGLTDSIVDTSGIYFIRYDAGGCFDIQSVQVAITKCCEITASVTDTICYADGRFDLEISLFYQDRCSDAFVVLINGDASDTLPYPESGSHFNITTERQGNGEDTLEIIIADSSSLSYFHQPAPFISEFHYDNIGPDINEGIEISGVVGQDLSGYQIHLYNGNDGTTYGTAIDLNGVITSDYSNCGSLFFSRSGIQNGPDGFALTDSSGSVLEFISYEGSFLAVSGPASGRISTDVLVSESSTGPDGGSIQLRDIGWSSEFSHSYYMYNPDLTCLLTPSAPVCADTIIVQAPFCPTDCALDATFINAICLDDATYQLSFILDYFNPLSNFFELVIDDFTIDTIAYPQYSGDTISIPVPFPGNGMLQTINITDLENGQETPRVFISEIHYDNDGTDENEGVEITAHAGTNLEGYSIFLYNGAQQNPYGDYPLEGIIEDNGNGCGAIFFPINNIQNGPDGIALIDPHNLVVEFLSYEGSFLAASGPAAGLESTDIEVSENNTTTLLQSLQKSNDEWLGPIERTPNLVNSNLTCEDSSVQTNCTTSLTFNTPDCPLFDLSLIKSLSRNQDTDIQPGDTVSFEITVINTGRATAFDIVLVDHITDGLLYQPTINTEGWMSDSTFRKIHSLAPTEDTSVVIHLILSQDFRATNFFNEAEIISAALRPGGILAPDEDDQFNNGSGEDYGIIEVIVCHPSAMPVPVIPDIAICNPDLEYVNILPYHANEIVLTEDFETDGNPSGYTTSIPEFSDGAADYFTRTDGSNTQVDEDDLKGISGNYWFGAQDIDGEGGPHTATIIFPAKDIRGLCNLELSVKLAEDNAQDGKEDWDGTASDNDFLHIDYSFDGTNYFNGIHIESSSMGLNTAPKIDCNYDGIGEGQEVTDSFQTFYFPIINTGTSMTLKITLHLDDGDEDIAIDDILISGTPALYNFYEGDPDNGGTLIANSVASYSYETPQPGNISKLWATSVCSPCTGTAFPFRVLTHPEDKSLACYQEINITLDENCQIPLLNPSIFYTSDLDSQFTELSIKDQDGNTVTNDQIDPFIDQDLIFEIVDLCTGNFCWGQLNVRAQYIPPSILIIDTISCLKNPVASTESFLKDIQKRYDGLCIPPFENISHSSEFNGNLCDTFENITYYYADFLIGDKWEKTLLYEHRIVISSININEISGPGSQNFTDSLALEDTVLIDACLDFDFSPGDIAAYWADQLDPGDLNENGINEGIPFAFPYLKEDERTLLKPTVFFKVSEKIISDSVLIINGQEILVDIILKDTIYDTSFITLQIPNYLTIDSLNACNINLKYNDTYYNSCLSNSKLIRKWTLFDWCVGQIKEFTQHVHLQDKTPPFFNILSSDLSVINHDSLMINGQTIDMDSIDSMEEIDIDKIFQIINIADPISCNASFEVPVFEKLSDNCTSRSDITFTYMVNGIPWLPDTSDYRLLHNIPPGTSEILITAHDLCGNQSTHKMTIFAMDTSPPHVFCKEELHVSLTHEQDLFNDGRVFVGLELFDQHSYDPCGEIILVLAQRLDNKFFCNGESIQSISTEALEFCCEDAGSLIPLKLTYFDAFGNTSICWSTVLVEDNFVPLLSVSDTVIDCDSQLLPVVTGYPDIHSNCNTLHFSYSDNFDEYNSYCRTGHIDRTWQIDGKPNIRLQQRISIRPDSQDIFNPYHIQWPKHYTGAGIPDCIHLEPEGDTCQIQNSVHTSVTCFEHEIAECFEEVFSQPKYDIPKCALLATNYEDEYYWNSDSSCGSFIRHWTIIDWCIYQPNTTQFVNRSLEFIKDGCNNTEYYRYHNVEKNGIYQYDQHVQFRDTNSHIILECENVAVQIINGCTSLVKISVASATSGFCSFGPIIWKALLYDEFGVIRESHQGQSSEEDSITFFSDSRLDPGKYKIEWKVTDLCKNESACIQEFNITDMIPPEILCLQNENTVFPDTNGTLIIWAKDFAIDAVDNCDLKGIYFRTDEGSYESSHEINCQDLAFEQDKIIWSGQVFAVDSNDNTSSCHVTLQFSDPHNYCELRKSSFISGQVFTPSGAKIDRAQVQLSNFLDTTDYNGSFGFSDLTMHKNYQLSVYKNDDLLKGITAIDLIHIRRHITGESLLVSPYLKIAADVNSDGYITVSDLSELQAALLGKIKNFTNNTSWRFVDANFIMENAEDIADYNEVINILSLNNPVNNADFIGIKIGDVNESSLKTDLSFPRSSEESFITCEEIFVDKGQEFSVIFSLPPQVDMQGIQFTMIFTGLDFMNIESSDLPIDHNNYLIDRNKLKVVWHSETAVTSVDNLFTLKFKASSRGVLSEMIDMNSSHLPSVLYTSNNSIHQLSLKFVKTHATSEQKTIELLQNNPNPFSEETIIPFIISESQEVSISVFDIQGNMLLTHQQSYPPGLHQITLYRNKIKNRGVLICRLESNNAIIYKKMIAVQ